MDPNVCLKWVISLSKDGRMRSRKIIVRGSLGLRLSALGLLLVQLILCQHMQNLCLLGNDFWVYGGGGGLFSAPCWEVSAPFLVLTICIIVSVHPVSDA